MTKRRPPTIQDFGEYIPGARKDLATHGLMTGMHDDPMFKGPISTSWPKPPWEEIERQHHLENRDTGDLALARAVRDLLKTRYGRMTEQGILAQAAGSADSRGGLRTIALKLLQGDIGYCEGLTELENHRKAVMKECGEKATLYQVVGHAHDLSSYQCYESVDHAGPRKGEPCWRIYNHAIRVSGRTLTDAATNLRAAIAAAEAEGGAKTRSARAQFSVGHQTRDGVKTHGVMRRAGGRWRMVREYPSAGAAARALKNPAELLDLEAQWQRWMTIPPERRDANERRSPPADSSTSSPNEFTTRFAFRGVQFGNWVEKNRRASDLRETSQALVDLARVLHWPESLLTLNGRLALAFGARGKGGRRPDAAHYEPGQRVIAISKPHGPGSLAHEWFHGLDDNCFDIAGLPRGGYATEGGWIEWRLRRTDPMYEFAALFADLGLNLRESDMMRRARNLDMRRPKSKPYWSTTRELAARAFEAWVIDELRRVGIRNDYLANIREPREWQGSRELDQEYPYPYPYELTGIGRVLKRIAETGLKTLARDRACRPPKTAQEPSRAAQAAQRTS